MNPFDPFLVMENPFIKGERLVLQDMLMPATDFIIAENEARLISLQSMTVAHGNVAQTIIELSPADALKLSEFLKTEAEKITGHYQEDQ